MEELLKELEGLKQKIADIEKKIEEKKVETGRWKPQKGDIYWFINDIGNICKSTWDNDNIDRARYLVDNYYRTKEKVRQAIDAIGEGRIKKYYLEVEE